MSSDAEVDTRTPRTSGVAEGCQGVEEMDRGA
jgi:hypothetical protein